MNVSYSFDDQDRAVVHEFSNVSTRILQVSTMKLDEDEVRRILKEDIKEGIRYLNMLKESLEGVLPKKFDEESKTFSVEL